MRDVAGNFVLGVTTRITPGRMPEKCKGRHNERIANVSVNTRNYQVSLQGGVDDELPEDSDGSPAGSPRRAGPEPSPSPGPGPWPRGNMHVIYM